MSQLKISQEENEFSIVACFILFRSSLNQSRPSHIGENSLPHSVSWLKCCFHPEMHSLSGTPGITRLPAIWAPRDPVFPPGLVDIWAVLETELSLVYARQVLPLSYIPLPLLLKTPVTLIGPTLMVSFKHNYLKFKCNHILRHQVLGLQCMNFGRTQFSP